METIYFKGSEVHTYGYVPSVGAKAPYFSLVTKDLDVITLSDFYGKTLVLNVFPSLDTAVCATTVRRFNKEAANLKNVTVLCVSMDLPFAMSRFCAAEGIDNVVVASAFRSPEFYDNYGLKMRDGALAGLLARCVMIIDSYGIVAYRDLVEEITSEPDYAAAIAMLKQM